MREYFTSPSREPAEERRGRRSLDFERVYRCMHKAVDQPSTLLINMTPPFINEKGFVEKARFFITIIRGEEKQTMMFNSSEIADMIKRLEVALWKAIERELELEAKLSKQP